MQEPMSNLQLHALPHAQALSGPSPLAPAHAVRDRAKDLHRGIIQLLLQRAARLRRLGARRQQQPMPASGHQACTLREGWGRGRPPGQLSSCAAQSQHRMSLPRAGLCKHAARAPTCALALCAAAGRFVHRLGHAPPVICGAGTCVGSQSMHVLNSRGPGTAHMLSRQPTAEADRLGSCRDPRLSPPDRVRRCTITSISPLFNEAPPAGGEQ